ncbi:hypothetical protein ACFX1S_043980 [Malus domestica]
MPCATHASASFSTQYETNPTVQRPLPCSPSSSLGPPNSQINMWQCKNPHAATTLLTEFNYGNEMKTTAEDVVVAYKAAQDVALANLAPPISVTSALILLLHSLSTQPGCSAPAQPTAPLSAAEVVFATLHKPPLVRRHHFIVSPPAA